MKLLIVTCLLLHVICRILIYVHFGEKTDQLLCWRLRNTNLV